MVFFSFLLSAVLLLGLAACGGLSSDPSGAGQPDNGGAQQTIEPVPESSGPNNDLPDEDGEHILYVNGEYRGDSDIGKLMHDSNCTDADDMNFALMAERTRYLKENPEGVSEMCKVIEDMRKEERIEIARNMLFDGLLSLEKIAEYARLPIDEVKKLREGQIG